MAVAVGWVTSRFALPHQLVDFLVFKCVISYWLFCRGRSLRDSSRSASNSDRLGCHSNECSCRRLSSASVSRSTKKSRSCKRNPYSNVLETHTTSVSSSNWRLRWRPTTTTATTRHEWAAVTITTTIVAKNVPKSLLFATVRTESLQSGNVIVFGSDGWVVGLVIGQTRWPDVSTES